MPRNQGTSRKGKPGKAERDAGMGKALQRRHNHKKKNGSSSSSSQKREGMRMRPGTESIGYGVVGEGGVAERSVMGGRLSTSSSGKTDRSSVLEMKDLDEFLLRAEMSNREFATEREGFVVLDSTASAIAPGNTIDEGGRVRWSDEVEKEAEEEERRAAERREFAFRELSLPRRPEWDGDTSAKELHRLEQEAFLNWRRSIAMKEEELYQRKARGEIGNDGTSVTPFEKNIEMWRQLWRVVERSDCIVQIVDGRNPLFYLSEDLRDYALNRNSHKDGKKDKCTMVLVNKADYLSRNQRMAWREYLGSHGWDTVLFFSATTEQEKLDREAQELRRKQQRQHLLQQRRRDDDDDDDRVAPGLDQESDDDSSGSDSSDDGDDVKNDDSRDDNGQEERTSDEAVKDGEATTDADDGDDEKDPDDAKEERRDEGGGNRSSSPPDGVEALLTREQLIEAMVHFARTNLKGKADHKDNKEKEEDDHKDNGGNERDNNDRIEFGMVGFPNVGKSSVINVLVRSSRHSHGTARVGVASQPGKTKHFQTLFLPDFDGVVLCDCPGLVFPSFVSNVADLLASGVYPLSQMRHAREQYFPVIDLICRRIPRPILETLYGITLPPATTAIETATTPAGVPPKPPTPDDLLTTLCEARGFLSASSGVPDYQRAARIIIQDYTKGKLLYCHHPPTTPTPTPRQRDTSDSSPLPEITEGGEDDKNAVVLRDDGTPPNNDGTTTKNIIIISPEEFHRETIRTALNNTAKLREKLLRGKDAGDRSLGGILGSPAPATTADADADPDAADSEQEPVATDEDDGRDDENDPESLFDDDMLELAGAGFGDVAPPAPPKKLRNRNAQKWGKKNRKNRNHDPYGCHSTPDDDLLAAEQTPQQQQQRRSRRKNRNKASRAASSSSSSTGVVVKAGKYSNAGYTRPTSYSASRGGEWNKPQKEREQEQH